MISICFTYFRSLTLANLAASLYSVRQQDLSQVAELVIVDNNTEDSKEAIWDVVEYLKFPLPVRLYSRKDSNTVKTHAWSSNFAVRLAQEPWIFFTRADYLLHFDALRKFTAEIASRQESQFITSNGCHLSRPIDECEMTSWRQTGPQFAGVVFDYTLIDAGVWLARKDAHERVGGLDERLTAWGHAQTDFQHRLFESGAKFVRIPETLFYHPAHGGEKNIDVSHEQLASIGGDLKQMWSRYHGVSPYA